MVKAPSSRADRTEQGICCSSVVQDGILVAILLIGQGDGDGCGGPALLGRGAGGNGGVSVPQADVTFAKRDRAGLASVRCVLSNPKKEKESQSDEISHGHEPGLVEVLLGLSGDPAQSGHRQSKLWPRGRVGIAALLKEVGERFVKVGAETQFPWVAEAAGDHDL